MKSSRLRPVAVLALLSLLAASSGCTYFHELKPSRLWRLNRSPAPRGGANVYYSVPEQPIPGDVAPARLETPPFESLHPAFEDK